MFFKKQKKNYYKIKYNETTILLKILDTRASVCCGRPRPPKRVEKQRTHTNHTSKTRTEITHRRSVKKLNNNNLYYYSIFRHPWAQGFESRRRRRCRRRKNVM